MDWKIQEHQGKITRRPTSEERAARERVLRKQLGITETEARLAKLPQGAEREKMAAEYSALISVMEYELDNGMIEEDAIVLRDPTPEEIAQREKDIAEFEEAELAAASEREARDRLRAETMNKLGLNEDELEALLTYGRK